MLIVQNKYQFKPALPFVPGSEYAGVVDAVGEGVTHFKVGDSGGRASAAPAALPRMPSSTAASVLPLPPGFAFEDAAAFALHLWHHPPCLDRPRGTRRPARRCWCWARPAAWARAAMQIAKAAGARVIAAASSDEKCALLPRDRRRCHHQLRAHNVRDELKELTDGKGPDVVYDPVGGDLAEPVFRSHRLARPLPGDRLCRRAAFRRCPEPGAAQGRVDRGRVLGRIRAPRTPGQRARHGRTGAVVRRKARSSRSWTRACRCASCRRPMRAWRTRQVHGKLLLVNG